MEAAANEIEMARAEIKKLQDAQEDKENEIKIKAVETEIKIYDSETKRLQAVQQSMTPEQVQAIIMQTLQDLMTPNTVQLESPMEGMQEPPEMAEPANIPPQGMEMMEQPQNGY